MNCDQCGKEISDGNTNCQHCGAPTNPGNDQPVKPTPDLRQDKPKTKVSKRILFGIIALGVIALLVFSVVKLNLWQGLGLSWAARVNGKAISVSDFDKRLALSKKNYEQQGLDFSGTQGKQMQTELNKQVLAQMIMEQLLMDEATKQKLLADDNKINTELKNAKQNLGGDAKYQEELKSINWSEADLKNYMRTQLSAQALYDKVTTGVTVSDSDVQNEYNTNKNNYTDPEQVKASHILVNTEEEAKNIIDQLDNGANFAELAKTKSQDPGSKANGGELGYFSKGQMDQAFETAAFGQKVGTYTDQPVKSQYGWHIILVEDHKQSVQKTFDEVKDEIKQKLQQTKKGSFFQQFETDLKNKATIEYAKEYEQYKS